MSEGKDDQPVVGSAAQPAADIVRERAPGFQPRVGIVLGSGMGDVGGIIEDPITISYADLPGFPVSTVSGHAGSMILGTLSGMPVACLSGRVHLYEGNDPGMTRLPIYTLKLLGCEIFFATSAVGSLRESSGPGSFVLLKDHVNLMGMHPLIGPNDPIGLRFVDMVDAYDPKLRTVMLGCAEALGEDVNLSEGVYLASSGPSFETPAEINAFRILGADVVGMSMVPDVLCARHCGLRVVATTIVVNLAAGMTGETLKHEETLHFTKLAAGNMKRLLAGFLEAHEQW